MPSLLTFWSRLLKVYQPLRICFLGPQTPVWICQSKFAQRPSALCTSVYSCVFVFVQICCLSTGHIQVYPYVSKKLVISATALALHHCESVKQNWCSVQLDDDLIFKAELPNCHTRLKLSLRASTSGIQLQRKMTSPSFFLLFVLILFLQDRLSLSHNMCMLH